MVALIGLLSFNMLNKPEPVVMDSKGVPSQSPQGDRVLQTLPTHNSEPTQLPSTEAVANSVLKIGDRVIIETDDSGSIAKKITLLPQDVGPRPPSGGSQGNEPLQMPNSQQGMPIPEGEPRGGVPAGLLGQITAVSEASITVSGRDGETTVSIIVNTTFESL